jgi:8-oxo-dGTP diphosphatase
MEYWDIIDKNRVLTGRKHIRGNPMNEGDFHLVVEIWIINNSKKMLLTKRHPDKPWPNLWECTGWRFSYFR